MVSVHAEHQASHRLLGACEPLLVVLGQASAHDHLLGLCNMMVTR
jgi:hypothetical protein